MTVSDAGEGEGEGYGEGEGEGCHKLQMSKFLDFSLTT